MSKHSPLDSQSQLHLESIVEAFNRDILPAYQKIQQGYVRPELYCRPAWHDVIELALQLVVSAYSLKVQMAVVHDLAHQGISDDSVAAAQARESCMKTLKILRGNYP